MKKIVIILIIAFVATFSFNADAQIVVKIRPAKPKVIVKKPHKARKGHVWQAGHWRWAKRKQKYVWVKGSWKKQRRGHKWVPGRWVKAKGGHRWVPGHWN